MNHKPTKPRQKLPDFSVLLEVCRLKQAGWTYDELAVKYGRSKSRIHDWVNKIVPGLVHSGMSATKKHPVTGATTKMMCSRVHGRQAPESTPTCSVTEESPEQKIARLERELRDATMMRDFYDEMINVAEKQFHIPIRKKSGARR